MISIRYVRDASLSKKMLGMQDNSISCLFMPFYKNEIFLCLVLRTNPANN